MTWLLDTNACIRYLNGRAPKLKQRIDSASPADLVVCSIVKAELYCGATRIATRPTPVSNGPGESAVGGPSGLVGPQPMGAPADLHKNARRLWKLRKNVVQGNAPKFKIIVALKVQRQRVDCAAIDV